MEENFFQKGYRRILAIDEVGRGSLAGPFFIGGLLLNKKAYSQLKKIDIKDSKKLSPLQRQKLFNLMKKFKLKYKIEKFSNKQIDNLGINYCFLKGIVNLYKFFKPDLTVIDGKEINSLKKELKNIKFIVKGDEKLISLGAISIISKHLRDQYMIKLSKKINIYHFEKHKGYGTQLHFHQIKIYGPSKYHRLTFIPFHKL